VHGRVALEHAVGRGRHRLGAGEGAVAGRHGGRKIGSDRDRIEIRIVIGSKSGS
jgi:hypothetical protein